LATLETGCSWLHWRLVALGYCGDWLLLATLETACSWLLWRLVALGYSGDKLLVDTLELDDIDSIPHAD